MPNWCEGSLKIRSKDKNNIVKFIKDCFMDCSYTEGSRDITTIPAIDTEAVTLDEDEDTTCITISKDKDHWIWLKNCGRSFIEADDYCHYFNYIAIFPFKTAWGINSEDWQQVSKDYNIDIRLYGVERGMEFVQEVEIINGEITLDREITYEDWDWQCPFPRMGG